MKMPAWTYSQLDSFESCPKKFYHLKVVRDVVEPPSVHTEWGTKVHTAFEDAIKKGDHLPEGMTQWQVLANKLAKLPGEKLTEVKFAIDRSFQPADWKNSWSRGIADLLVVCGEKAAVMDYKTGKRKPSEQLDLYANYVFHHYPQVNKVTTGFVWLKDRRIDWKPITRSSLSETWQSLLPRVRKLESAYERDSWPARPSGLCNGWCPVTSCQFNKDRSGKGRG
ncbi:MAG: hypothetical protein RJA99_3232 [Pseudomonadota bacterium]|jgi:hypothetical protein